MRNLKINRETGQPQGRKLSVPDPTPVNDHLIEVKECKPILQAVKKGREPQTIYVGGIEGKGVKNGPGNKIEKTMRTSLLIPVVLILMLAGCTSMKTLELPSSELQSQIRAGQLLAVGDKVTVVTANGVEHKIQLTGIDGQKLQGTGSRKQRETIVIDEIVAVQTRDISAGKTALLTGGVIGVAAIALLLAAPVAFYSVF